jgi:prepilin signal peptidase PulO-like enzyme (type II secretory pathway)
MNPEQSEGNRPLDSTLSAVELFAMVRAYVKQETLDPLRGVGRWLAWGTAGAVALLFGAVVGLMGILRLLQAEIFDSTQAFSFVPYLIVAAVAVVLIWLSLTRIQRPSLHPEK